MSQTEYARGDVVPLDFARRPFDEPVPPERFIFTVPPRNEESARCWVQRVGAPDAWYPTKKDFRILPRGHRRKVPYQRRVAPGYVFVLIDRRPVWDVLFQHAMGRLSGVICQSGVPLALTHDDMVRMDQVPLRLQAMRRERLEWERQDRLENRPAVAGGCARICEGLMAGRVVAVESIRNDMVQWVCGPLRGSAPKEIMEGIASRRAGV